MNANGDAAPGQSCDPASSVEHHCWLRWSGPSSNRDCRARPPPSCLRSASSAKRRSCLRQTRQIRPLPPLPPRRACRVDRERQPRHPSRDCAPTREGTASWRTKADRTGATSTWPSTSLRYRSSTKCPRSCCPSTNDGRTTRTGSTSCCRLKQSWLRDGERSMQRHPPRRRLDCKDRAEREHPCCFGAAPPPRPRHHRRPPLPPSPSRAQVRPDAAA